MPQLFLLCSTMWQNSEAYYGCLPNTRSFSSLSSITLSSSCSNRSISRASPSSDSLNKLLLLCSPGLLLWESPEHSFSLHPFHTTLVLPCHTSFSASCRTSRRTSRFILGWLLLFFRYLYAFCSVSLYIGIYFIHDKGQTAIDLMFWLYMQLQRYLLLPFSSITPTISVFSIFPLLLQASCAPVSSYPSPLLRVRVI